MLTYRKSHPAGAADTDSLVEVEDHLIRPEADLLQHDTCEEAQVDIVGKFVHERPVSVTASCRPRPTQPPLDRRG